MTVKPKTRSTLTGLPLADFLHRAASLLKDDYAVEISGQSPSAGKADRKAMLADLLTGQEVRPDCPAQLIYLAELWVEAGQPEQAVRALQRHQPAVLSALSGAGRLETQGDFALLMVDARREWADQPDAPADAKASLRTAVADAADTLSMFPLDCRCPHFLRNTYGWEQLIQISTDLGDHALARRCMEARHAVVTIVRSNPVIYRAWNRSQSVTHLLHSCVAESDLARADAQLATQLAHSFAARGDSARADDLVGQAIASLAGAVPEQDVNEDDWVNLGDALFPLANDRIGQIVQHAHASLGTSASPALQRDLEVRAARLRARVLHDQGQIEEALVQARLGCFELKSDCDDQYIAVLLDLLLQAGQCLEAAQLAIECVWTDRSGSGQHACKLALQHVERPGKEASFWWALTLACATAEPEPESESEFHKLLLDGCKPAEFFARYLALARKQLPGHVAADVVEGYRLALNKDYSRALPLLEQLDQCPDIANPCVVYQLWLTRVHVLGPKQGLTRSFVESPAGGWSSSVALRLAGGFKDRCPDAPCWPTARLDELITRYYERGQILFEAFFATGKGRFCDGNAFRYSTLCGYLGDRYRLESKQWDKAVALHEKGNAAFPSSAHYAGLMWCHNAAGRKEAFVDAADRLWHHASESHWPHEPTEYFPQVCLALVQLERDAEIPFWLQRFVQWGNRDTGHWEAGRIDQYMETLLQLLRMMARKNPDDALAAMTPLLEEIRHSGDEDHIGPASGVLERARKHKEAIEWYESALVATDPGKEENNEQREAWLHRIAGFEKTLREQNPLWKGQR